VKQSGPLPPTYWTVALVLTIGLHFVFPIYRYIHWPWSSIGIAIALFGGWITLQADSVFKRRGTTVKPFEDATELVTDGPFRISRHPMYFGMTMILLGVAILLGSVIALAPAVAFAVAMQVRFIPAEEASLERVFGEAYRAYAAKTRRWV